MQLLVLNVQCGTHAPERAEPGSAVTVVREKGLGCFYGATTVAPGNAIVLCALGWHIAHWQNAHFPTTQIASSKTRKEQKPNQRRNPQNTHKGN